MKTPLFLAALLAASTTLIAQEPAAGEQAAMPNPKLKEHEVLASLAGTWDVVTKMEAMPGIEGMEKPTECTGTEHAELICNGLWLKSVGRGEMNGQPMEMLFLVGYDPFQKTYRGLCASSCEPGASEWKASYDEKSKTFTWTGKTPHGDMRSTVVLKSPDQHVETCYLVTPDGKEVQCMQMTRTRSKGGAAPVAASAAKPSTPLAKEQELLHKDIGVWNAKTEMAMEPGQPPTSEPATETVQAICGGAWIWTDFNGQMMGQPFSGHALYAYDPGSQQYVNYWIDSWTPVWMETRGNYDAEKSTITLVGTGIDQAGKPMDCKEVITYHGADKRVLDLEFKTPEMLHTMRITYARKK